MQLVVVVGYGCTTDRGMFRCADPKLSDVVSRLELERRICDGARNMLQLLDQSSANEAMRRSIEHELALAEEHVKALETKQFELEQARPPPSIMQVPAAPMSFLHPRAIRPVHNLDGLGPSSLDSGRSSPTEPLYLPESRAFPLPVPDHHRDVHLERSRQRVLALTEVLHRMLATSPPSQDWSVLFSLLSTMLRDSPTLASELDTHSLLQSALQGIALGPTSSTRAYAMRLLRYLLQDDVLPMLLPHSCVLTLFLSRALLREDDLALEREQALKLIRALMATAQDTPMHVLIPEGLVRTMAAIAFEPSDPLYHACVETLVELALLDPALTARAAGFPPLWQALSTAPAPVATALVENIVVLLDRPATRRYISAGTDLEAALAGFTSVPMHRTSDELASLQTTRHVVVSLLLSWQGLVYLCMQEQRALRTLFAAMYMDDVALQVALLDTLSDVMTYAEPLPTLHERWAPYPGIPLFRHYMTLVVLLCIEAGLLPALAHLLQHATPMVCAKASAFTGRLLALVRDMCPHKSAEWHAFPVLVQSICRPASPLDGMRATNALTAIAKAEDAYVPHVAHSTTARVLVDDHVFRAMLRDSMVTATKEYTQWHVPVIHELLQGPLRDPRRLEEALTGSKWIRRLLALFRPLGPRFVLLQPRDVGTVWIEVGVQLFRVLVSQADGLRVLSEDRFLSELHDVLDQLATGHLHPVLSHARWQETAVRGLFALVQVLSEHTYGAELLVQAHVYTPLLSLCARDDDVSVHIVDQALHALDMSHASIARTLLEHALTGGSEAVRCRATSCVAERLWIHQEPQGWAAALLSAQLYDIAPDVRTLAMQRLREACAHPLMVDCVMAQGPPWDLLASDDTLALRSLGVRDGFVALRRAGWLTSITHAWQAHTWYTYVADVESCLAPARRTAVVPPHLYGQLAKTEEGCAYLEEQQILPGLLAVLQAHATEAHNATALLHVKAVLWACGHIGGASEQGMHMLQAQGWTPLWQRALQSPVVSVRGTCFYAAALLAASAAGRAALAKTQWLGDVACLPKDVLSFVFLPATPTVSNDAYASRMAPADDEEEEQAATMLSRLGNGIVAGSAWRALLRMRQQRPALFTRMSLLARALHLLDHFAFRLAARRHVWTLFDAYPLTLDTAYALQKWRVTHVKQAPAVPARRVPVQDVSASSVATRTPHQYRVPPYRMPKASTSDDDGEPDRTTTADVHTSPTKHTTTTVAAAMTTTRPHRGSVQRHAWPLQVHGFV